MNKLMLLASCALCGASVLADAHTKSVWKAKDSAWDGKFSETAHWSAGVPDATVSPIVDGYFFNQADDYTVFFDKPATLTTSTPGRITR